MHKCQKTLLTRTNITIIQTTKKFNDFYTQQYTEYNQ